MDQAIKVGNQYFINGMTLMREEKFSKAVQNFEVAANKFLCSASMHFLGRLHLRGEHVPKDIEKANRYLNCAANMGCLAAVVEIQGAQKLQISKNDACGGCGKLAQNFCSRCKSQKYCSVQCQLQAWPNHKSDCAASIFEMD